MIFKKYIHNVLVSLDQLVNTLLGGDVDETISSRCGKGKNAFWRFMAHIVDFLFYKGHCKDNIEYDEGKDAAIQD